MTERKHAGEGPGLPEPDQPGKRSGSGAQSVVDQMHKDQQRNSNEPTAGEDDLPRAALDASD